MTEIERIEEFYARNLELLAGEFRNIERQFLMKQKSIGLVSLDSLKSENESNANSLNLSKSHIMQEGKDSEGFLLK